MKKLIDRFRKEKILNATVDCKCDIDGDVLVYKNVLYYVDIQKDYIDRIRKVDKKFREETQNNEKL